MQTNSTFRLWMGHIIYLVCLGAFGLMLPREVWDPEAKQFILLIGAVAVWRYSWGLLNWIRYHIYVYITFPRWRKQAQALGEAGMPPHVYLLVTSFRIGVETTRRVYDSVFREAIHYGRPCTIVASIVERADQTVIKQLFERFDAPDHVRLVFVRIAGTGKRDALACGFRAISKMMPGDNDVAAVVDGDSLLEEGLIAKCAPLFILQPDLGALTTDELCEVEGKWIFREWYNMRFAQRHIFMASVSLSRRVLTLTGRMSMFRAHILTDPQFIERVELDWIDHWRLGRFKFLTGDDKSSWFDILKGGYAMLYVPDVKVLTIETPPMPSFIDSSFVLMRRWFGNMLRTNGRAIALGPKPMGWFPWISIIDQRLSMWTALSGLMLAIMASILVTPFAFLYYLLWIGITRYVLTLSLLAARPSVSAYYPFLLYYNQIIGSLVKTYVLFRLDKQKWTRQNTTLKHDRSAWAQRLVAFSSMYMHIFASLVYIVLLAWAANLLMVPDIHFWEYMLIQK